MPRPRNCRCIRFRPGVTYFKPRGVPISQLREVVLGIDEFEALRLVDGEGLGQIEAAKKMEISQSTLQRILTIARQKVSQSLTMGKAIKIEGGVVRYCRCMRGRERNRISRKRCIC